MRQPPVFSRVQLARYCAFHASPACQFVVATSCVPRPLTAVLSHGIFLVLAGVIYPTRLPQLSVVDAEVHGLPKERCPAKSAAKNSIS
jgi:hypothetical protein